MKKYSPPFSLFILILVLFDFSWAQVKNTSSGICLSGNPEVLDTIQQLESAEKSSSFTQAIYQKYFSTSQTQAGLSKDCEICGQNAMGYQQHENFEQAKDIVETQRTQIPPHQLALKSECLLAAGKITAGQTVQLCPSGKTSKSNKEQPCFTEKMTAYQNAVITDYLKCFKTEFESPLSADMLFELFANESGLKPYYQSGDGTGFSQIIGQFFQDVKQNHRGQITLKQIEKSSAPECDITKKFVIKDQEKNLSLSDFQKNKCAFTAFGEGFERNLLYAFVGLNTKWQKDISPAMKKYSETYKNHPLLQRAQQLALMNSYGPGGAAAARAVARNLRPLAPEKFIEKIQKPQLFSGDYNGQTYSVNATKYLVAIKEKQKTIAKEFPADFAQKFSKEGAKACLNN